MRFSGLVITVGLAACSDPVDCPAVPVAALEITLRDSLTGAPPPMPVSGTYTIKGRQFLLGLCTGPTAGGTVVLCGGGEAGGYSVSAIAPGYEPWTRSNILVRDGTCGPQTVRLEARLQAAGP